MAGKEHKAHENYKHVPSLKLLGVKTPIEGENLYQGKRVSFKNLTKLEIYVLIGYVNQVNPLNFMSTLLCCWATPFGLIIIECFWGSRFLI